MISLDEARALLLDGVEPLGAERLPLDRLDRRVLAEPVVAAHDQPAEARALMDGVALARDDQARSAFRLVGEAASGSPFAGTLAGGEAIRIATGAVVPDGAGQVVPKEVIELGDDGSVTVREWPEARFIRAIGSDFRRGQTLLERGARLGPASIALIAAANRSDAAVYRRPAVAILSSGDELVEPGGELGPGQSVDSASFALAALARRWNADPVRLAAAADDRASTEAAMASALDRAEVLVTIGGASVGDRDHMRPAASALGAELRFERINLQPGKPCWHARAGDGRFILGLPGNPTSAYVCAHLLLRPLLRRLGGLEPGPPLLGALLDAPLAGNGRREQFVRAHSTSAPGEALRLAPLPDQDSGLQAPLVRATHLIRQAPGDPGGPPGTRVEAIALAQEGLEDS